MMKRFLNRYNVQTTSKLVKAVSSDGPETTELPIIDAFDPMQGPDVASAYSEIAKDFITHAAVAIGVTYCVCKIVGRICK